MNKKILHGSFECTNGSFECIYGFFEMRCSRQTHVRHYGVATVRRIDKIIGLLCGIYSFLYGSFAKETYNLNDPTNQRHLILVSNTTTVSPVNNML